MGEEIYNGDPGANVTSLEYLEYVEGFKIGCYGLVEYAICMAMDSTNMTNLIQKIKKQPVSFFRI